MSIRIAGNKLSLRRTVNLPTSFNNFTIVMCAKLVDVMPTHNAHLIYAQGDAGAGQSLQVRGLAGTSLRGTDNYESTISGEVAVLSASPSIGQGWFGTGLRGTATGAGGMQAFHKPIGSGTLAVQAFLNTPGADTWDVLQLGDAPFAPGDFGVGAWWAYSDLAHVKIYDRALSDAEITAELSQAEPVSVVGLLSYHSFGGVSLAAAMTPQQGSGDFFSYTSDPSISLDMPSFAVAPPVVIGPVLTIVQPLPLLIPGTTVPVLIINQLLPSLVSGSVVPVLTINQPLPTLVSGSTVPVLFINQELPSLILGTITPVLSINQTLPSITLTIDPGVQDIEASTSGSISSSGTLLTQILLSGGVVSHGRLYADVLEGIFRQAQYTEELVIIVHRS